MSQSSNVNTEPRFGITTLGEEFAAIEENFINSSRQEVYSSSPTLVDRVYKIPSLDAEIRSSGLPGVLIYLSETARVRTWREYFEREDTKMAIDLGDDGLYIGAGTFLNQSCSIEKYQDDFLKTVGIELITIEDFREIRQRQMATQDFIHPARVEAFRQMATLPEDIMPFDERDLRVMSRSEVLNFDETITSASVNGEVIYDAVADIEEENKVSPDLCYALHLINSLAREGYKLKSAPNEEGIIQYEWDKD